MVLSITDLNDDILDYINEILKNREKLVYRYVMVLYRKFINNNICFMYYYLKYNNTHIKNKLITREKVIQISKSINKQKTRFYNFDYIKPYKLYKFEEIIDDIVEKYNLLIYDLLNHLIFNRERILNYIDIIKSPSIKFYKKSKLSLLYIIDPKEYNKVVEECYEEHFKYIEILAVNDNLCIVNNYNVLLNNIGWNNKK